jgi:hypothetical protein
MSRQCIYTAAAPKVAQPDSDVDLASTASVGNYVRFADEWQRDLSDALKLDVRLAQYNCRASTPHVALATTTAGSDGEPHKLAAPSL